MLTKKEAYALTKEMLFHKFEGLCALCGCELGDRWHIWHIRPNKTIVTRDKVIIGDESYENKLPACISCNSTRIHNSSKHERIGIEGFRNALKQEFNFLSQNTYFRKAIKFGVIQATGNEIVFHFENHHPKT